MISPNIWKNNPNVPIKKMSRKCPANCRCWIPILDHLTPFLLVEITGSPWWNPIFGEKTIFGSNMCKFLWLPSTDHLNSSQFLGTTNILWRVIVYNIWKKYSNPNVPNHQADFYSLYKSQFRSPKSVRPKIRALGDPRRSEFHLYPFVGFPTVDGCEILHQLIGGFNWSAFYIFLPSQVQDFQPSTGWSLLRRPRRPGCTATYDGWDLWDGECSPPPTKRLKC